GYRFAHDVIREIVEQDLSPSRRQLLHRRIGEALERDEATPVASLAFHFARSDDQPRALRYLEGAGDEAQPRCAHTAAAGFFREVIARRTRAGRTGDAAPIEEKLGAALHLAGQYDEAIGAGACPGRVPGRGRRGGGAAGGRPSGGGALPAGRRPRPPRS